MAEQKPDRPNRRTGRGNPSNGGMRWGRGLFGWMLFATLCIVLFMLLNQSRSQYSSLKLSDVLTQLDNDNVKWLQLEPDLLKGELRTSTPFVINAGGPATNVQNFRTELPPGSLSQS